MPLQATSGAVTYDAYGGGVTAANYIEDVFSTWLYTGTSATQSINNGIDLSTKGGLVWVKRRSPGEYNVLTDTARGAGKQLFSDLTASQSSTANQVTAFNTNGFTLGADSSVGWTNLSPYNYASWTFRKQPKFFDVVTYTGTGSARTIAHSLDSVPGCMIIKRTDDVRDWAVYHRSLGATKGIYLNSTAAEFTSLTALWNGTTPTSTEFSVGTNGDVNASGGTYVAYLFAHDAGGFGRTGTDNVISCGSFTTPSGSATSVNLGYEPQFVLFKATNTTDDWYIADNMRGFQGGSPTGAGNPTILRPNTSQAEGSVGQFLYLEPTGFNVQPGVFSVGTTFIYIAIRRGPMKTPTTGTSVYEGTTRNGTGAAASISGLAFPPDAVLTRNRDSNSSSRYAFYDKLRGPTIYLDTAATDSEFTVAQSLTSFNQTGESFGTGVISNANGEPYINWQFRRAPGFMDVVCYTGNGSTLQTFNHNLGVVPELVIIKRRSSGSGQDMNWPVAVKGSGSNAYFSVPGAGGALNLGGAFGLTTGWAGYFGPGLAINATTVQPYYVTWASPGGYESGQTYVAYLFASVAGVSKVGSYTGTGTTLQIDCGFTGGARFVLIKRTDSTGDWYVWDSARGIVSGNDPYLLLNTSGAEVQGTDYVDTYSAGFEISSTAPAAINANGGSFIFLAIA
jgi:hypothetical protein